MAERFAGLSWGLNLNSNTTDVIDLSGAVRAGCSFVSAPMDVFSEEATSYLGDYVPNPHWASPGEDLIQSIWDAGCRVLVGVFHFDLLREAQGASMIGEDDYIPQPFDLNHVQWKRFEQQAKNKFLSTKAKVIWVIHFTRWKEERTGVEVDATWVPKITSKVMQEFPELVKKFNAIPNGPRIKADSTFLPMLSMNDAKGNYADAGGRLYSEYDTCATDHNVTSGAIPWITWPELATWRPTDHILGHDGEYHQGPDRVTDEWKIWLNCGYAYNMPGMQGNSVGFSLFNGVLVGNVPQPEPEPESEPDPEPEPQPQPKPGRPLGIDVSYWQGNIDWQKVADYPETVMFAGVRAGLGATYKDPRFLDNWNGAKSVGIARAAYHVFLPDQDVDKQIDSFCSMFDGDPGELPEVVDIELDNGKSREQITNAVRVFLLKLFQRTGRQPIIYSRASWVNMYMNKCSWFNDYDWWMAHYLSNNEEHPGPPFRPDGVNEERVVMHQTSQKGDGLAYGVESKQIDLDRWQRGWDHFYSYVGITDEPVPEPLTLEERVADLERRVAVLEGN